MKPFTVLLVVVAATLCAALATRPKALKNLPEGRTLSSPTAPALVISFAEKPDSYLFVGKNGPVTISDDEEVHSALAGHVRLADGLKMPDDATAIAGVRDPSNPERLLLIAWKRPPEPPDFEIP